MKKENNLPKFNNLPRPPVKKQWSERKTWDEFRSTGLFLFINGILHAFGWAIAVELDEKGIVTNSYPMRVKFRGFSEGHQTESHEKIANYLAKEAVNFPEDIKDE